MEVAFDMSEIFCSNCGKIHKTAEKQCEYCGTDLADKILRYKESKLPIKYEQSISPEKQNDQRTTFGFFNLFKLFCCHGDCPSEEVQQERKRVLKEKKCLKFSLIAFIIICVIIMVVCILALYFAGG